MREWKLIRCLGLIVSIVAGMVSTASAQSPIDPTIVRINGTSALTGRLLPAVAAQQKLGKASISRYNLDDGEFLVLGFGSTWETYLTDVSLNMSVAKDSLSSVFKSAPANKAEIDTNYQFKNATLKLTFHVRTDLKTPFDGILPKEVKEWTTVREAFYITVNGFAGEFDLTLKKTGNFVEVDSVDKFNVQVDDVKVSDSARILELAKKIASVAQFFKVPGATSVNDAAKKLANHLLKEELEVRKDLRDAMNESLKRFMQMGFGAQTFPLAQQGQLTVSGTLDAMQTSPGRALTQWSLNVQGKPSGAVPNLAYTYLARPAQDVGQISAQGDVEVFVPYSLMDKAMYELIQMGSLGKINVPPSSASGGTVGFDLKVEPTEIPRVNPVAKQPGVLAVEFGARMANTQVGTVDTGTFIPKNTTVPARQFGPPPVKIDKLVPKDTSGKKPTPIIDDPRKSMRPDMPVSLTNGSGRVSIFYRVRGTNTGRLYLQYAGVSLNQITGSLRFATATVPLTQFSGPLQNAINAHLGKTQPQVTLIPQPLQLVPGVSVQIGQPRIGGRYIGVPLTLVAN